MREKALHRGILLATVAVIVLLALTNIFKTSKYAIFLTGEECDLEIGEIDGQKTYKLDVENPYEIKVRSFLLGIRADGSKFDGEKLQISIYDGTWEQRLAVQIDCRDLDEKEFLALQTEGLTLKGDFVVVIEGIDMDGDVYPILFGSSTSMYDSKDDMLYTRIYADDELVDGQPYLFMETDVTYAYGNGVLLILLLLLIVASVVGSKELRNLFATMPAKKKTFWISFASCSIYLLYWLFAEGYRGLCSWIGPWYVLHYGMGAGSRFFLGTIMRLFFYDEYLQRDVAYRFVLACSVLLILLLSFCIAQMISKSEERHQRAVIVLILFYLASPGAPGHLWNEANMGRLELYLFLLSLAALLVNERIKRRLPKYLLLAAISAVMILMHQGGIFTFFAVIFLICICNTFREGRVSGSDFIGSSCVAAVTSAIFVFVHFFSRVRYTTLEEMAAIVSTKTNLENNAAGLYLEYFSNEYGMFENCFAYEHYRICGIIQLLLLWPLTALAIYLFVSRVRYCIGKKKKMFLTPYPYLLLFNLLYIPLFMFECDWGRWFGAIITTKTIEVLYLLWIRDAHMCVMMGRLQAFFKNKEIVLALILIYLASFEKFGSALFLEQTQRWYQLLFPL
ncbi:MAG: hypothetical protein ACI4DR_09495 [Roseburia sp.]